MDSKEGATKEEKAQARLNNEEKYYYMKEAKKLRLDWGTEDEEEARMNYLSGSKVSYTTKLYDYYWDLYSEVITTKEIISGKFSNIV